jgi:glycosyltransferase involved in cell wall biosynthesis
VRPPLTRGKSVVTIHDVSFLRFPETMEEKNRRYLTRCMRDTVDRADAIVTDCAFVADELRELMNVPAHKLHPILLGMSRQIADAPAEAVGAFRKARGLERPYLLHVGTVEPRKNHLFLIKVFERLRGFDGDLVLAGMRGWKCDPVFAAIAASPKRDRIRYLEYVSDDDLPALYTGAEALVFPSLYEGFGFPPLEAMSCGTPVVSSTAGSLAEVLGGGARLITGYDESEWAQAVESLLGRTADRVALTAAGRSKAAEYNWDRTAAQTWDLYRRLGNSSGGGGIPAAGNP